MTQQTGKKYEKDGKYPADRSLTDILCCIIFLAATGFSIFLAVYGFSKGNLSNIMQPYDSSGNPCGVGEAADFKFLYLTSVNPTKWTDLNACVKKCPETEEEEIECKTNEQVTDCGSLPKKKTYLFGSRFCISTAAAKEEASGETEGAQAAAKFSFGSSFETFQKEAYGDVVDSWKIFLVSVVIAILISLLYLFLLETCAAAILYTIIIAMIVSLGLLGWMFWGNYQDLQKDDDPKNDNEKFYMVLAIVTWVISGILVLCFCCFYSQISLAAKIIEATADYITDYARIILVPIVAMIILVVYLSWWLYSGAYLFSIGTLEYNGKYPWGEVKWDKKQT